MAIQGLISFDSCLLPRLQVFQGWLLSFKAFSSFDSSLLSHQKVSSRNPETTYHSQDTPCFFTSLRLFVKVFHLNYPRFLLFFHCLVPMVTMSCYFYLFNGCFIWYFYIRLSLVYRQNFPSRKIDPAPLRTLPWNLSSKGCLRCFFLVLISQEITQPGFLAYMSGDGPLGETVTLFIFNLSANYGGWDTASI